MNSKLELWRNEGKHLPEFLRDFHDQKDLFKYLHDSVDINDHDLIKNINWMQGHAYTIDIVLFILAKYGWTLQRSRSKQDFANLDEVISQYNKTRNDMFTKALLGNTNKNNTTPGENDE
jgi:hypothetical protein